MTRCDNCSAWVSEHWQYCWNCSTIVVPTDSSERDVNTNNQQKPADSPNQNK